jgi:hypothetical protein
MFGLAFDTTCAAAGFRRGVARKRSASSWCYPPVSFWWKLPQIHEDLLEGELLGQNYRSALAWSIAIGQSARGSAHRRERHREGELTGRSNVAVERRAESLRLVGGRAVLFDERMNALDEEVGDRVRRVPDVDRRNLAVCFPSERGDQSWRWVRYETESSHPLVELCTRSCQSLDEHDLHGNPSVRAPVPCHPPDDPPRRDPRSKGIPN